MEKREYSKIEDMVAFANKESDRGCALILSSNLDNRLKELLENLCIKLPLDIKKRLFSGTGGLATFSSRIDMCYALGHLGEDEHRDLHLIRKIRNEFAHHEDKLTFDCHSVKSRCSEFRLIKEMENDYPAPEFQNLKPRDKFQIMVSSLYLLIQHRSRISSNKRPNVPNSSSIFPKK